MSNDTAKNFTRDLCTFAVGDALFGVDILRVQEINRQIEVSPVPLAPEYVFGVMNLRGRVVTVMDLGRKLGLEATQRTEETRNVIVNTGGELIGLLVDRITDVVAAQPDAVDPPPANLQGVRGTLFEGVVKGEGILIGILNVDELLRDGA